MQHHATTNKSEPSTSFNHHQTSEFEHIYHKAHVITRTPWIIPWLSLMKELHFDGGSTCLSLKSRAHKIGDPPNTHTCTEGYSLGNILQYVIDSTKTKTIDCHRFKWYSDTACTNINITILYALYICVDVYKGKNRLLRSHTVLLPNIANLM